MKTKVLRTSFLLCLFALTATTITQAATVTVTISGSLYSGTDYYDNVFSTGTSLTGDSFTLTFTFDDSDGTPSYEHCSDGTPYWTSETGSDTSATAQLSINSSTPFTFGGTGLGWTSGSWFAGQYAAISCSGYSDGAVGYHVQASYSSGGYSGSSTIGYAGANDVQPAAGYSFTSGADWRSKLSSVSTNTGDDIPFYIEYSYGSVSYYAYGYLAPSSISISSPGFAVPTSEAATFEGWLGPDILHVSDPSPSGPVGVWLQTLTMPSGYLTNIFSAWRVKELDANVTGYTDSDTCNDADVGASFHYSGSPHLTGSTWHVTSLNVWGDSTQDGSVDQYDANGEPDWTGTDPHGNSTTLVTYLRSLPSGTLPCSLTRYQQMEIDFSDGIGFRNYGPAIPNKLVGTIDTTTVSAGKSNDPSSPEPKSY